MRTCLVSYPKRTPRTLHPAEGRGTVLMTKMQEPQEKMHVPSLRHYLPMRVEPSRPHALQKALPSPAIPLESAFCRDKQETPAGQPILLLFLPPGLPLTWKQTSPWFYSQVCLVRISLNGYSQHRTHLIPFVFYNSGDNAGFAADYKLNRKVTPVVCPTF